MTIAIPQPKTYGPLRNLHQLITQMTIQSTIKQNPLRSTVLNS